MMVMVILTPVAVRAVSVAGSTVTNSVTVWC